MNILRFEQELRWVLDRLDEKNKSAKTLRDYRVILQRLNKEIPGGILQPPAVVRPLLEAWRSTLQHRLRLPESHPDRISQSKVTCDVSALRAFYDTLVQHRRYESNPTQHMSSGGRRRGLPRPMPHIEFNKLCLVMDQTTLEGLRDRTMVELAYHGLRNFEVCSLRLKSVEYLHDNKVFQLRIEGKGDKERLGYISNDSSLFLFARYVLRWFAGEKSSSEWITPEGEDEPNESRTIRAAAAVIEYLTRAELRGDDPLFRTASGSAPNQNWFCKMFRRYRDEAGLSKQWGPHSLRHSCATDLLSAGEDLRSVQKILGHNDIRSTVIYTDVVPNMMVSAMRRLTPPQLIPEPKPEYAEAV